jgi:hypothetical protein
VMKDQRLAALWPAVARRRLVTGFDLVLAPAWSVYDDDPRLLAIWNGCIKWLSPPGHKSNLQVSLSRAGPALREQGGLAAQPNQATGTSDQLTVTMPGRVACTTPPLALYPSCSMVRR